MKEPSETFLIECRSRISSIIILNVSQYSIFPFFLLDPARDIEKTLCPRRRTDLLCLPLIQMKSVLARRARIFLWRESGNPEINISYKYVTMWIKLCFRFFLPAALFMCVILPTWIPYYFWSETLWHSLCTAMLRYCLNLNAAFSVNSFAHWIGSKPYDESISSADNEVVALFALGKACWRRFKTD